MAYTRNNGKVSFDYDSDDLFDLVAMQSSYVSRSIKDKDGNYLGEEFALTHDEDDAFSECLSKVSSDLAMKFRKMCIEFNIEDGFEIGFVDNGISESVLKLVDGGIQNVLVYGILRYWYELCGNTEVVQYCAGIQTLKFNELWGNMFEMRNRN